MPKDVLNSKSDLSSRKSCLKYNSLDDYDDCVYNKVSTEIGNLFNCSLPFLKPNERFEECKLDSITKQQREDILRTYEGIHISLNDFFI